MIFSGFAKFRYSVSKLAPLTAHYVEGELTPSAEILSESVILYGRGGSVIRTHPSFCHIRDTTMCGLLGGLGFESFGPKTSLEYVRNFYSLM